MLRLLIAALSITSASAWMTIGNGRHDPPNRTIGEYRAALNVWLQSYLSPNNAMQAASINSTLLSPEIVGRVDVTETYEGRELTTEYVWGLFANAEAFAKNGTTQLIPYPFHMEPQGVIIQPPMAYSSVIGNFSYPTLNLTVPIQMDVTLRYEEVNMTVISYDAVFRRFPEAFATMLPKILPKLAQEEQISLAKGVNATDILATHAAREVCEMHQSHCTGDNAQYSSYDECYNTLYHHTLGQPWEMGHDTLMCRYLHRYMIPSRPSVHCPHIGLSGGGKCADNDYYARTVAFPFPESFIPQENLPKKPTYRRTF